MGVNRQNIFRRLLVFRNLEFFNIFWLPICLVVGVVRIVDHGSLHPADVDHGVSGHSRSRKCILEGKVVVIHRATFCRSRSAGHVQWERGTTETSARIF